MTANGRCDQIVNYAKCGQLAGWWTKDKGWDCGAHGPLARLNPEPDTAPPPQAPRVKLLNRAERRALARGKK